MNSRYAVRGPVRDPRIIRARKALKQANRAPATVRASLVLAVIACMLAGAALAVALTKAPPGSRYDLVCGEQLQQPGGSRQPVYYPCASVRP